MAERGVEVHQVTVYRWVQRFTPLFADAARTTRHATGDRWRPPAGSMQRLGGVLEDMDGGTVVIAGPRGGGKTTLIEAIIGDQWSTDPRHGVVLFEQAPVEYQPREFALHLYARLCQQVIATADPHAAPAEPPSRIRLLQWAADRHASLAAAAAGLAAVLVVLAVIDTARAAALVGLGVLLLISGGVVSALPRSTHAVPPVHNAEPPPVDWASLADQAKRRLAHIRSNSGGRSVGPGV